MMNNWEDITVEAYDAWMQDLQSDLEHYEDIQDEQGTYELECDIRSLANLYAEQIKREGE